MTEHERVEAPDLLMGAPDGEYLYVPELGVEVPTFVDPREDLIPPTARGFKRLFYHIPFNMRGFYKPQWLPPRHYAMYGHQYRTDTEGYVLCAGTATWIGNTGTQGAPHPCGSKAVNRSPYCRNHGGALHPCDKRLSSQNVSIGKIEPERKEDLDRVQKFMAGFLDITDLEDDEIIGSYVRNNEGRPIFTQKMGLRFQQMMVKELLNRMNRFMQMKLPNMVKVLTDIAESDFAEPRDRITAADIIINRTMGKVADVVYHGSTEAPYEVALARIQGGSREEYRSRVASTRPDQTPLEVSVVDDETELEPDGNNGSQGDSNDSPSGLLGRMGQSDSESSDSGGNQNGSDPGVVVDHDTRVTSAKDAKERLKKAKNRRFAGRSQGTLAGDIAWLIEYIPLKSGGFKAKLYPPELQTQAVLDRIRDAELTQIGA